MSVYDEALTAAVALYGEQEENLSLLCRAAVDSYTARLREGLTAEDCGSALTTVRQRRCRSVFPTGRHALLRRRKS